MISLLQYHVTDKDFDEYALLSFCKWNGTSRHFSLTNPKVYIYIYNITQFNKASTSNPLACLAPFLYKEVIGQAQLTLKYLTSFMM